MKSVIVCAIIGLIPGYLFAAYVLEPLVQGIGNGIPCPANEQWEEKCLQVKAMLYLLPSVASAASALVFLKKIGVIDSRR